MIEIVLIIALIIQAGVFLYVFKMLERKDTVDDTRSGQFYQLIQSNTNTFIEQLSAVEKSHFEQVEKQSSKQLTILEKQTRDFLSAITDITENMKPPIDRIKPLPDLLDKSEKITNSIEKEEPKDYFLDEIARIPNINDMNVKFLDNEQILGEDEL